MAAAANASTEGLMSVNQPVKLTMLMLLSLLLLSYGVGSIQCATVLANNTDMSALLDFRAIANDPTGALGSWNSSIHYCKWRGVTCGSKHPEQVTALNLTGYGLSGPIAASVGNISFLHTLDLSNNQFSGQIPSLSNLQKMQFLNLSFNSLEGHIPDSLTNCSNLRLIDVSRNSLEGEIPLRFDLLSNLLHLILSYNKLTGVIPPTLSNITGVQKLRLGYNNLQGSIPEELGNLPNLSKRSRKSYLSSQDFGENFPKVSYNDLAQSTRNFSESNLIGKGSCGSVYRGRLKEPDMEVAVKVFNLEMRGAERSFISECETLRSIQHRNLLSIVTACSTVDNTGNVFKALVYEFMPNGNLDTWLHYKQDGKANKRLDLNRRISIAVNIADVMDYLHHDCGRPTVHCDLKPSNILLNDEMTALLGDFGIAKFYADYGPAPRGSVSSVGVKGTIGYIAPDRLMH
uniref:Protein kinase domain-containing protein n=1 Tax=Oryza glumipatula TaxID=40148 RepID=A0A0E0BLA2_9ORYZ